MSKNRITLMLQSCLLAISYLHSMSNTEPAHFCIRDRNGDTCTREREIQRGERKERSLYHDISISTTMFV